MNINTRKTALTLAVAVMVACPAAFAQDDRNADANIQHDHLVNETRNFERNTTTTDTEVVNSDIRKEANEHRVSVSLKKDLSLSSDIRFRGRPTITGDIDLDSAAIAIVDNRQSISDNDGTNDLLTNDASISDDVAEDASGNLGFNVAAGDNNVQDNAAALSAADASFAFGMADAEVFVNQSGRDNITLNQGVTNAASISGNAFANASGNIGVNVASGNNNAQKNALAASVATTAYAQSSVSSNQNSMGNTVENQGHFERRTETIQINMTGTVDGSTAALGFGGYQGETSGSTQSRGNAFQANNYYPDTWNGAPHPNGSSTGHIDMDGEAQGAVDNPYRDGTTGGLAFDTDSRGRYEGREEGDLGFLELGVADLDANLSGQIVNSYMIAVNASNTADLSGNAFNAASGNIGVNIAAGTGNLQANSLALAVAQPSTGGGGGGGGE